MTILRWPTKYLVRWPTSLQDLTLTHSDLTFCVAFNKTIRASKVSGANEAEQVSHTVWAKLEDLSKPTALFKSKFRRILKFGT